MNTSRLHSEVMLSKIARHQSWLAAGSPEQGASSEMRLVLMDSTVSPLRLRDLRLESAVLVRCDFSESEFVKCDFSGALLFESIFSRARFLSCEFRKAEMNSAKCVDASFSHSGLTKVDFSHTDLRKADLTDCDMSWSALLDTDLRYAILENVNLDGARLVRTKLYNERRFHFTGFNPSVVKDVLVDADASGPPSGGLEALNFLKTR